MNEQRANGGGAVVAGAEERGTPNDGSAMERAMMVTGGGTTPARTLTAQDATNGGAGDSSVIVDDGSAASVHETLHRLHDGQLSAGDLPIELRRRCVEHMTNEGFSLNDIAELMRMSERTIGRDRAAVRAEGAMRPGLELGDELMGEYERITQAAVQRLRRLSGDPKAPAYARLWATEATTRVYERFVERVHQMKYCTHGGMRLNHLEETDPLRDQRDYQSRVASYRRTFGEEGKGIVDMLLGKKPEQQRKVKR